MMTQVQTPGGIRFRLTSMNWRSNDEGTIHYWSSLPDSAPIPTDALLSGSYSEIVDNWAAILLDGDDALLLTDLVRSQPLFYSQVDGQWVVSDHVEELRLAGVPWTLDQNQADAFASTGFTLNEGTLIGGVKSVEAGSCVSLSATSDQEDTTTYVLPLYQGSFINDPDELTLMYEEALDKEFSALLRRADGAQLAIPLSGGLDSRLVAAWLRRLDAPNIVAFTYGKTGAAEVEISKQVASELEIPWVFVDLDPQKVSKAWFSEDADEFRSATWSGSALPHVQDWYALSEMRRNKLIDDDAIILPGHTPVGAMHNLELLFGSPNGSQIAHAIASHHDATDSSGSKLQAIPEFRRAYSRAVSQVGDAPRRVQNVLEWFNFRERQAKYINNSMKAYEHFGWRWALPLYWPQTAEAWLSGSEELTASRKWYRDFVDQAFKSVASTDPSLSYAVAPAESNWVPFQSKIVAGLKAAGAAPALSRAWKVRTELSHPLALESYFKDQRSPARLYRLLTDHSLMGVWANDFLRNEWGSPNQRLVPESSKTTEQLAPDQTRRHKVLVVSYSAVASDARLRRQVDTLLKDNDVTLCCFGPHFDTEAELVLLEPAETRLSDQIRAAFLHTKLYGFAQKMEANNLALKNAVRGRKFDAAVSNDIESVGALIDLYGPDHVHADIHEFYPGLQDQDPAWVKLRQPYYEWMLRNHAAKAASTTTVSHRIAQIYNEVFGMNPAVVENARPNSGLEPTPVHEPIRLVHAGAALPNRHIEEMMLAVGESNAPVTMDLYLTQKGTDYYASLVSLARDLGPSIRINDPVDPTSLVTTLNAYDLGIFLLPPTNTNYELTLPNKLFDFVQARLGIIVGPTREMKDRVIEHELGAVTESFDRQDLVRVLNSLTPQQVSAWKKNSDRAAKDFDVTPMLEVWSDAVAQIIDRSRGKRS